MPLKSRKFGIEIEVFINDLEELKSKLEQYNIPYIYVEKGKEVYFDKVKLTRDSSLFKHEKTSNLKGIELDLPPSEDYILLEKICNILQEINAKPIYNCALHIHMDCTDLEELDVKRFYLFYKKNENSIKELVKQIQPNNDFKLNRDVNTIRYFFEEIKTKVPRFYNLNIKSYYRIKTVEHRIFSGTINFDEIKKCVELTQNIFNKGVNSC